MSETLAASPAATALGDAHTALDALASVELGMDTAEQLLAGWRELQRLRNRIASIEHGFIAEADAAACPTNSGPATPRRCCETCCAWTRATRPGGCTPPTPPRPGPP